MFVQIATLRAREGQGQELLAKLKELVEATLANEPGTRAYELYGSPDSADTFVIFEKYDNEDALNVHRRSDHFRTIGKAMGPFMAGPPEVQVLSAV